MNKPKLFISYSHPDEFYKDELVKHLSTMKRNGELEIWHDRVINPGQEWDRQINCELLDADIILLLVSSDFIASDYCNDIEVKTAIEKHEAGKAIVIPVILRACDWTKTVFAKLQALPKNAKPVKSWHNETDEAFLNIIKGIRQAINIVSEEDIVLPEIPNPLEGFPVFPMVESEDVPKILIEAISKSVFYSEAEILINEANRLRKKADPDDKNVTVIELYRIQAANQLSAYDFWIKVIGQARLHGPKMLAALLLTIPDNGFTKEAKQEKDHLLNLLKTYKNERTI